MCTTHVYMFLLPLKLIKFIMSSTTSTSPSVTSVIFCLLQGLTFIYMSLFVYLPCLYPSRLPKLPEFIISSMQIFLSYFLIMGQWVDHISLVFSVTSTHWDNHSPNLPTLGLSPPIIGLDTWSWFSYDYLFIFYFFPPITYWCFGDFSLCMPSPFWWYYSVFPLSMCDIVGLKKVSLVTPQVSNTI